MSDFSGYIVFAEKFCWIVACVSFFTYLLNDTYKDFIHNSYTSTLFLDSQETDQKNLSGSILILHFLLMFPVISVIILSIILTIIILIGLLLAIRKFKYETINSYSVLIILGLGIFLGSIAMGTYKFLSTLRKVLKVKYNKVKDDKDIDLQDFEEFKSLNSNDKHEHSDL